MDRVFVSSVMSGFEAERGAVRRAIESLGLRALMAENAPASVDASKTALLARVDEADVLVLVLGSRYGYIAASGRSPTEEEFDHAVQTGTPVLVFVQKGVDREPEQEAFVRRVQGTWEEGAFTGFFADPTELGFAVVQALTTLRSDHAGGDAIPAAVSRAHELVALRDRRGYSSGKPIRVVFVPVGSGRLIDALVLDDGRLTDRAAAVLRQGGLVPQAAGIDGEASSAGLRLASPPVRDAWVGTTVTVADDGAVVMDGDAAAEGSMGSMAISQPKVEAFARAAGRAAQGLWALLPAGHRVRQVAAALSAPEAEHTSWSASGQVGGSIGVPSTPGMIVAPDPPIVLRRADVGGDRATHELVVSLRQAFADHGALRRD